MGTQAANQPFQQPAAPVAPFSPDQQTAFQNVRDTQGFAQPYFDMGTDYMTRSAAPVTGAETENYLNPYTKFVMGNLNEQFGQQQRDITGKLTSTAGGVGADRIAVGQSELARQQGLAGGQTMAGIYQQALQAAQADKMRQANAGFGFSMMGPAAQEAKLRGAGAQLGIGGQQQQLEQAKLMSPFQQELARIAYPFQTSQFLSGITAQQAPGMGGTATKQEPAPSIWSQLLGAGTTAASIYGGMGGKGSSGYNPYGAITGATGSGATGATFAEGGSVHPYNMYQGYEEGGDVEEQPFPNLMDPTSQPNLGQYPFLAQNMPSIVPQLAAQRAQAEQPTQIPPRGITPPVGPPPAQGAEYGSSPYPMTPQSNIEIPLEGNRAQQFAKSPWLGLTAAGLGIMGGTSPYAGVNIGKGGLEGVKVLEQQRTQEGRERSIDAHVKHLMQQAEQHRAQLGETTRYHNILDASRRDALSERSESRADAMAARGFPGTGQDEQGQTVQGFYQYNPSTRQYDFRAGIQATGKGSQSPDQMAMNRFVAETRQGKGREPTADEMAEYKRGLKTPSNATTTRVQNAQTAVGVIDDSLKILDDAIAGKTGPVSGAMGAANRYYQFGKSFFTDYDTSPSDFQQRIELLQSTVPRLLASTSRISAAERGEISSIVGGLSKFKTPEEAKNNLSYLRQLLTGIGGAEGNRTNTPSANAKIMPPAAKDYLRENYKTPGIIEQFDERFGVGAAAKLLGIQ